MQSNERLPERGGALISDDALRMLPTAACVCDAAGRIVQFNAKAAALWGRAPEHGETWLSLSGDTLSGQPFMARLQCGEPVSNARLGLGMVGKARQFVLANTEPVRRGGKLRGTIVTFQRCPEEVNDTGALLWDTLDALPAAIYTTDADGRITFYNRAAAELWGLSPEIGTLWCGSWMLRRMDGSELPLDECPMAIAIKERRVVRDVQAVVERPDGSRVAILPHPTPLYDAKGTFVGAVNMLVDITHQKVAEERHILFARELNHRVKNALATVYALAMQTLRYTDSVDTFRESFSNRLLALSRAHDLLVRSQWQDTPLKTIVAEALASFGSNRLDVEGDEVGFGPRATLTLAMTFHELLTNATHYGALSNAVGRVSVRWRTGRDESGDLRVEFRWKEQGGPPIEAPAQAGFGSRLINHNLMALGGSVEMDYAPDGFECRMAFPVINEQPGWPAGGLTSGRPSGGPAGPASPGGPAR